MIKGLIILGLLMYFRSELLWKNVKYLILLAWWWIDNGKDKKRVCS